MKKWLLIIVAILLLLILALASVWWWLTGTRSGAEFALGQAGGAVPSLSWSSMDGSIRSGLRIEDVVLNEAGTGISIDRLELAVRIPLLPSPRVDVNWLRAFDVRVELPPGEPPDPDAPPFRMPDIASPVPVTIEELLIERLAVQPAGGEAIEVDRIALSGSYHERLELTPLTFSMPEITAEAEGHWGLKSPFSGELALQAGYAVDDETRQQVDARLSGRLDALTLAFETDGPARIEGQTRVRELPESLGLDVELTGEFSDWPGLDLAVRDIDLRASGAPDDWEASVGGRVVGFDLPANRLSADLSGSTRDVRFEPLRVDVLDGQIVARGQVGLDPEPTAVADLTIEAIDVTSFYPDWPEQARISGRLSLEASGERIRLEQLDLSAPPTSLSLTGSGQFDPEQDRLALDLNWQDLNWPPSADATEALYASESGRVQLRGAISDWQLEVEALLRALDHPAARVDARASGDETSAVIDSLQLATETVGRLAVSGPVRWSPEPGGQLRLALDDFDLGYFVARLPGRIDARIDLNVDSPSELDVIIETLDGTLRQHPLSGSGRVALHEQRPRAGRLDLALGDNRLNVVSDDGSQWQWEIVAPALEQVWPELSGTAELDGVLDPFAGDLSASGRISDGGWGDIQLASAELSAELGWQEPRVDALIRLDDLDLNPWERIERLEVRVDGDCDSHQLGVNLTAGRGSLDLAGRGSLPDCLDGPDWRGELERLYIGDTAAGDWALDQAIPVERISGRVQVGAGCLVESRSREGRICLDSLSLSDTGRIEAGLEQVPMDLLLVPLDPAFSLTTPLSGEVVADWSQSGGLGEVTGFLALGDGAMKTLEGEQTLLGIDAVRIDIQPDDGRHRIDLEALLEGQSRITGQASLADLNRPADAAVNASAQLDLPDIGVFNRLVPELDRLAGRLEGRLDIDGPLRAPAMEGNARIAGGEIVHAPLGLHVREIELAVDGNQSEPSLTGRMVSGEGHLSVNGGLALAESGWGYDLSVEGERFSLADVDWLSLSASPRIQLEGTGEALELDGDIHIDRLRAGLPPGTETRVSASPDVQVRGETVAEDSGGGARMSGRLGIHLGEDALLAAAGMQTELAGSLELLWEPPAVLPRGRGAIRLPEGSYRAYGQNLEINGGEILFTGNPIDNPVLDIRAVRDIFGDPEIDAAGVAIRGSARDPEINLFTEPPTSEEKALAYVVTGADFDHAGGQGAVNVGFYMLPKLFVSYGIGLFEAGNVLSGRYELSERWGVRVVSGERDTGVDVSFAVDR